MDLLIFYRAILNAEKEGGEDLDAFKYLFLTNHDPDDMKKKLIYSVYSLEIEKYVSFLYDYQIYSIIY